MVTSLTKTRSWEDDLAMEVDKRVIAELVESAMSADYTGVRRAGGAIACGLAAQGGVDGVRHIQPVLRRRRFRFRPRAMPRRFRATVRPACKGVKRWLKMRDAQS